MAQRIGWRTVAPDPALQSGTDRNPGCARSSSISRAVPDFANALATYELLDVPMPADDPRPRRGGSLGLHAPATV
jgi:hypothetical protein